MLLQQSSYQHQLALTLFFCFHSELNVGVARIKVLKKQTGIIRVFEKTNNIIYISAIV